jgi:hypothetical protein
MGEAPQWLDEAARLVGDLTAGAQHVAHGPELGVLSDSVGGARVSVAIGHLDQLLGFRCAGERNRAGDGGRTGIADVVGAGVPGQAGIARCVRPVDPRGQPAVAGAGVGCLRTRTEQQGDKDKSGSHKEPRPN